VSVGLSVDPLSEQHRQLAPAEYFDEPFRHSHPSFGALLVLLDFLHAL
jgi:hypothetical protein